MSINKSKFDLGIFMILLLIFSTICSNFTSEGDPNKIQNSHISEIPSSSWEWDPFYHHERIITFDNGVWNTTAYPISILGNGSVDNPYLIQDQNFIFDPTNYYDDYILFHISNISCTLIFQNCSFYTTNHYCIGIGIRQALPGHEIIFRGCVFENFKWREPIYLSGVENGIIESCTFIGCYRAYFVSCSNIHIFNNTFERATSNALRISSCTSINVTSNSFNLVSYSGIVIVYLTHDTIVKSNTIRYCKYGIAFGGSKTKYLIHGEWTPWEYSTPVNTTIENNTIEFCSVTGIDNSWTNSTHIFQNTIRYCGENGVFLAECRDTEISENIIDFCSLNNIWVNDSYSTHIYSNYISNAGENGVYIHSSKRTEVRYNKITYSGNYGVRVRYSTRNKIRENIYEENQKGNARGFFGAYYQSYTVSETVFSWLFTALMISFFIVIRWRRQEKKKINGRENQT